MLSQKCKYAIRAVIYIASQDSQKRLVGGAEVATALTSPTAFTVKILQELARKNILQSTKGPKGGFYISDESKQFSILKIVEAIDDLNFFSTCGVGLTTCSDEHPCPFHDTFKELRDTLYQTFQSKTIGDFCVEFYADRYFLSDVLS